MARSLNANTRGWEDWHAELASIRGHLAEHRTLPDPGQLARARGGLPWYEAEAVAAVAAVAAGLGGIHAAQETASLAEGQEAPDASGTEAPATPAVAPGPARQEEHPPAAPAAGPGQPETAPVAGQAAADLPGAVAPAPASPAQAPGPDEPAETGPYSGRVRIALESGRPVVSGTDFNDPPELREALRDNFTWD